MTVFAAIADDNRRAIFDHLVRDGSGTATALATTVGITRQAAAKHLSILADAGLATSEKIGRETRFRPVAAGLTPLHAWVDATTTAWDRRLDTLADRFDS
ncbi:MAG: winged helix-turn-helix domain-containing protein [Actinomycetota bacterium]